jgi:hypothetical protein
MNTAIFSTRRRRLFASEESFRVITPTPAEEGLPTDAAEAAVVETLPPPEIRRRRLLLILVLLLLGWRQRELTFTTL